MIKNYLFAFSFLFSFIFMNAQSLKEIGYPQAILKPGLKMAKTQQKTPGAILYSEDFDSTGNAVRNGLPQGWILQNNAGNSFNWIWSNAAPGGQYSTNIGPLQSTTGSNGYLLLPSDLYNTPTPTGGFAPMDASVTSPAIPIVPTASVTLRFEHFYRYCCGSSSDLVVEVSSDGVNWTAFDITLGRSQSNVYSNPELMEFDVTTVLGNQSTAYIRFRQTGASHYFFMVDDLELVEGYSNAIELTDCKIEFSQLHQLRPVYTQLPLAAVNTKYFEFVGRNIGSNTLTGTQGRLKVYHDSTYDKLRAGAGLVLNKTVLGSQQLQPLTEDTFNLSDSISVINDCGYYRFVMRVESDSINQALGLNEKTFDFIYSDTVCARDRGVFLGSIGPGSFVGSNGPGDRLGVLYEVPPNPSTSTGLSVTSISIYVANDTSNIGLSIKPKIWQFDETKSTIDSAIINSPVGDSPFATLITANDLGKWISIAIFTPNFTPLTLSAGSQYVVGFEQINGNASVDFSVGRDLSMEENLPIVTNFVYLNDATPSWGWINNVPGIRLNISDIHHVFCGAVGLEEKTLNSNLSIYPNPSNGQFALRFKTEKAKQFTLKVRNNLGQIVLEEELSINGSFAKAIDLSASESGIYFLSLENEKERFVKKLVIQ